MATLSGEKLYSACGYAITAPASDDRGGAEVPLYTMAKAL